MKAMTARQGRDSEFDELLAQIDPEDLLVWLGVDYITTRGRSGVQLNIKECPRCGGRDRKVYLNAETGLGNCFHGACTDEPGFNLFTFARALLQTDNKETKAKLKEYARTTGWRPKPKAHLSDRVKTKATDVQLPASYALPIKGKNLTYLVQRGISAEVTQQLGWRWCKSGQFAYTGADGQTRYQDYSGRVIIPVFDLDGQLRTFQGRDVTGTSDRKYLFPPGLAGTGQFLYNAHNALGCETLVLCEGAFDVAATMMALQHDHTERYGIVGTFGKKISMSERESTGDDQLTQLYRLRAAGAKRVIFLWDGEATTIQDACDEALALRRYGFDAHLAILPPDKDPNEVPAPVVRRAIRDASPVTPMKAMQVKSRALSRRA